MGLCIGKKIVKKIALNTSDKKPERLCHSFLNLYPKVTSFKLPKAIEKVDYFRASIFIVYPKLASRLVIRLCTLNKTEFCV